MLILAGNCNCMPGMTDAVKAGGVDKVRTEVNDELEKFRIEGLSDAIKAGDVWKVQSLVDDKLKTLPRESTAHVVIEYYAEDIWIPAAEAASEELAKKREEERKKAAEKEKLIQVQIAFEKDEKQKNLAQEARTRSTQNYQDTKAIFLQLHDLLERMGLEDQARAFVRQLSKEPEGYSKWYEDKNNRNVIESLYFNDEGKRILKSIVPERMLSYYFFLAAKEFLKDRQNQRQE